MPPRKRTNPTKTVTDAVVSHSSDAEPARKQGKRRTRPPAANRITSAQTLHNEREALRLRQVGATLQQIADKVGYSDPSSARRAIYRALSRVHVEEAATLRDIEGLRLDQMQLALSRRILQGDTQAIDTALRIMKRRADLFGLDHAHGIAERAQRVNESHAAAFANILTTTLDSLDLTPAQQEHAKALIVTQLQALTGEPEAGAA